MSPASSPDRAEWERMQREALTEQILRTLEAKCALERTPSQAQLEEFCQSDEDLQRQMEQQRLSAEQVARALFRQEWLRNTLDLVADRVVPATRDEALRYYEARASEWVMPETRLLAHILITVQEEDGDNSEQKARARIESICRELNEGRGFSELAQRWSECPTALEEGVLGWVPPGQLYPELDEAAFALQPGERTPPVRTELGWHLVECRQVRPEHVESFEAVEPKLIDALTKQRRVRAQKKWVSSVAAEAKSVS